MRKRLNKMLKRKIEKKVKKILKEYTDKNSSPLIGIDAVKLAKFYGFTVGESDKLPYNDDGFIFVSRDGKNKIIGVNNNRTFEEKRFIVVHELAHYFLHKKTLEKNIMLREHRKGKDVVENDADYFAACILMPADSFKAQYNQQAMEKKNTAEIIENLQKIFYVSKESVIRRIGETKCAEN